MIVDLAAVDGLAVRSAINVFIDVYEEMVAKEKDEIERALMANVVATGRAMLDRFRRETFAAPLDLPPSEVATLERALRMSVAKWHRMITPSMAAEQKQVYRAGAREAEDVLKKVRRARGLPS